MNELELLSRYGAVEPIERVLIDATVEAILNLPSDHEELPASLFARRRLRRRRFVVVSASAAVAALATFATITAATGSSPVLPSAHHAPAALKGAELTAYVTHQSLLALDTAGGYVVETVQQGPSGTATIWRGPNQTLIEGPNGTIALQTWAPDGSATGLSIDYQHHTWFQSSFRAPVHTGTPPPAPADTTPLNGNGTESSATAIAAWFKKPGINLLGTDTIRSTPTYELQIPAVDPNGKPVPGKSITAWVDTSTYLPVRIVESTPAGQGWNNGVAVTIPPATVSADYYWHPATPQALSVFNLTPPPSFQQVPDPAQQPVPPGH